MGWKGKGREQCYCHMVMVSSIVVGSGHKGEDVPSSKVSRVPRFQGFNVPIIQCSTVPRMLSFVVFSDWIMATTAMARQHWQWSAGSWLHSEVYVGGKETALLLQPLAPPG